MTTRDHRICPRIFVLSLACGIACGPTIYDSGRKTVKAAESFVTSAVGTLERYDHDHQIVIAREGVASGDSDRARARLAEWEKQYQQIRTALIDAQALVKTAPDIIDLIEVGARPKGDLVVLLAQVAQVIESVRQTMIGIGVKIP